MRVWMTGGKGDGSGCSDSNGGAFETDDSRTILDSNGANGAPLDTTTSATITDNGSSYVRVTSSGSFTNSLVGVYVYISFVTGTYYTTGRYKITDVDGSGNYIDLDLAYDTADDTADLVNVGGSLDTIDYVRTAALIDNGDSWGVANNQTWNTPSANSAILEHGFTVTGSTSLELLQNSIIVFGYDATTGLLNGLDRTELDASSTASSIIADFRTYYKNFTMHGGSSYGVNGTGGKDLICVMNCEIYSTPIGYESDDNNYAYNNYIHDCTNKGIIMDNSAYIHFNTVKDCTNGGIEFDGGYCCNFNKSVNNGSFQITCNYGTIMGNWLSGSSGSLAYMDEQNAQPFEIHFNVFDGQDQANTVIGFEGWKATNIPTYLNLSNNIFYRLLKGVEVGTDMKDKQLFIGNMFYDVTTKYDSTITISHGETVGTGDPGFVDADNYDYRCLYDSIMRNAGHDFSRAEGNDPVFDMSLASQVNEGGAVGVISRSFNGGNI